MLWMKLTGSVCILAAGGLAWYLQRGDSRRETALLLELSRVLEQMASEIQCLQTPLPRLLEKMSANRTKTVSQFLRSAAESLESGDAPSQFWRTLVQMLPLNKEYQAPLLELESYLDSSEERLRGGLTYSRNQLLAMWETRRTQQRQSEQRNGALFLSAAALTVILLL